MHEWRDSAWYEEQLSELAELQDMETAHKLAVEGAERYPDNTSILADLGFIQLARGDFAWARRTFARILDIDPNATDALVGMAEGMVAIGNREEAERLALTALHSMEPGDSYAAAGAARIFEKMGRDEDAHHLYTVALGIDPNDVEAWTDLGATAHRLRRDTEAIGAFVRALEIDPDRHDARIFLGHLLFDAGMAEDAVYHWELVPIDRHMDPLAIERLIAVRTQLLQTEDFDASEWEARIRELEEPADAVEDLLIEVASRMSASS